MVKGTHRGSVNKDGGAVRPLGGAETSRRGRAATAPRRQQRPQHGLGRQSPSLTPRRGRRQSPSAIALFLSKKRKHVRREAAGLPLARRVSISNASSRCNRLGSVDLTLDELRRMTNNFSDDQLLGEGAFGKVYKGVLNNGDMIAVKRFASTITGLQDVHYETEAQHLMWLKHPNIVQLVGYCSETEMELVEYNGKLVFAEKLERLLCLEYMPKGSLRDHLSDETSGLEWNTRYKIIEGICYGVHYLHEEWQATPILHMDLKPANILLDDNMVPKIADFGLSRLFGEEQTRTWTRSCRGTRGYMAPEYLEKGVITKMFDIFSLGVIIIEIITGLKDYPTEETETTSQQYIDLVLDNWRHRFTKEQVYTSQDIDYKQIKKCIQIGLLCVKFDREERPTINHIIKMLKGSDEACQLGQVNHLKAANKRLSMELSTVRQNVVAVQAENSILQTHKMELDSRLGVLRKIFWYMNSSTSTSTSTAPTNPAGRGRRGREWWLGTASVVRKRRWRWRWVVGREADATRRRLQLRKRQRRPSVQDQGFHTNDVTVNLSTNNDDL